MVRSKAATSCLGVRRRRQKYFLTGTLPLIERRSERNKEIRRRKGEQEEAFSLPPFPSLLLPLCRQVEKKDEKEQQHQGSKIEGSKKFVPGCLLQEKKKGRAEKEAKFLSRLIGRAGRASGLFLSSEAANMQPLLPHFPARPIAAASPISSSSFS